MGELFYVGDLKTFAESGRLKWIPGTNQMWIQQYPFDTWSHPMFSDTTIDLETANKLKDSFDRGIKGTKSFADYDHGYDKAKGNKAAGEILELKVIESPRGVFTQPGLWARVEFTDSAKAEIDAGEWNYWSTSHYDTWTHPHTGAKYEFVYDGGGLTNKPWVKGMAPLNFSELGITDDDVLKEYAVLDAAARKKLPDSAYMYTAPDGTRMFPFKHADGSLDEEHLQKIVQLAPRANVPDPVKGRVIAKAKKLLGAKSHNEQLAIEGLELDNEMFDEETPDEGGEMDTLETELRTLLGLGDDANIVEAVTGMKSELEPMREALKAHSERKAFAEQYPKEAERLEKLERESRENDAKRFAESYVGTRLTQKEGDEDKQTTYGLSALAIEKIGEFAKTFSEGTADLTGFKDVLDSVMSNGIVDYGTRGSSREDENDDIHKAFNEKEAASGTPQEVRKAFADKVVEIMKEDEVDYQVALTLAVDKYPQLAEAYRTNMPTV